MKDVGMTKDFLAGVNNGTVRAVSNGERVGRFLEVSRQYRAENAKDRNNWRAVNLVCEELDYLRVEDKISRECLGTLQGMLDDYYVRCSELEIEIEWLRRPLWVKIVSWFAR